MFNIEQFETYNSLANNHKVLLVWKNKKYESNATAIVIDVSRYNGNLCFGITLRLSNDAENDEFDQLGLELNISYQLLAEYYGKTINEIRDTKINFNPNLGTLINGIPNQSFTLSTQDPLLLDGTNDEIDIGDLLRSILDYNFK